MARWKAIVWGFVGAGAAIVAGTFARRKYEEAVLEVGRGFHSGEIVGREGGYQCEQCGYVLALDAGEKLAACPQCDHSRYLKIS